MVVREFGGDQNGTRAAACKTKLIFVTKLTALIQNLFFFFLSLFLCFLSFFLFFFLSFFVHLSFSVSPFFLYFLSSFIFGYEVQPQ